MRWRFAPIALLGLAITAVSMLYLKGGESMPLLHYGSEVVVGVPPSDIHHSGTFETATFALG